MEDIGVSALRAKIDVWHEIRGQIRDLEDKIADLNKTLSPLTSELIEIMDSMDLTRFEGSVGRVNLLTVDYVNNPKTDEDRQAFFEYLKGEGIFEEMVSVHNGKLNSFYKARLEDAQTNGKELHIPGLEPKQRKELRKGR